MSIFEPFPYWGVQPGQLSSPPLPLKLSWIYGQLLHVLCCVLLQCNSNHGCVGRTKVKGTENPEKNIHLYKTIWRSDSIRTPGNTVVGRRFREAQRSSTTTSSRRTSSSHPCLIASAIIEPPWLILIFHVVTRNSITCAWKPICSKGTGNLRSDPSWSGSLEACCHEQLSVGSSKSTMSSSSQVWWKNVLCIQHMGFHAGSRSQDKALLA